MTNRIEPTDEQWSQIRKLDKSIKMKVAKKNGVQYSTVVSVVGEFRYNGDVLLDLLEEIQQKEVKNGIN